MTTWTIALPNHAPDVTVVADEITTRADGSPWLLRADNPAPAPI